MNMPIKTERINTINTEWKWNLLEASMNSPQLRPLHFDCRLPHLNLVLALRWRILKAHCYLLMVHFQTEEEAVSLGVDLGWVLLVEALMQHALSARPCWLTVVDLGLQLMGQIRLCGTHNSVHQLKHHDMIWDIGSLYRCCAIHG